MPTYPLSNVTIGMSGHAAKHNEEREAINDLATRVMTVTGTGSPEGSVTATVGVRYIDTNATRGAVEWIKATGTGNTGWRVVFGETGWRDLSALIINGWAGVVQVSRRNYDVTFRLVNLQRTAATSDVFMNVVDGFRVTKYQGWMALGAQPSAYFREQGVWEIFPRASAGTAIYATVTFTTDDPWPTTLPGTAA